MCFFLITLFVTRKITAEQEQNYFLFPELWGYVPKGVALCDNT